MLPEVWVLLFIFHILVLWSHGCRMQGWHPEVSCQEWGRGKGTREAEGSWGTQLSLSLFLKKVEGSSLAVQHWLSGFTAVSWVQSLVRELRWPPPQKCKKYSLPRNPTWGISPYNFLARNRSLYTLKLQGNWEAGLSCVFGPVKYMLLPQIKSEFSSNKECGVGVGPTSLSMPSSGA